MRYLLRDNVLAFALIFGSLTSFASARASVWAGVPAMWGRGAVVGLSEAPLRVRIGLSKAKRLYGHLPTGAGVVAGQVEAEHGDYLPRLSHFGDVKFIKETGPSKVSGHANTTYHLIYGPRGLAPGIDVVHSFDAGDWMGRAYLHTGEQRAPASDDGIMLFNHSWIGHGTGLFATRVLRRVDYVIDHDGVVMCAAVNNGRGTKVPGILSSSYNAIVVGALFGKSSGGYTRIATAGRCKPDLIGPKSLTSFATPVVTACAARLLEAGREMAAKASENDEALRHAARPEVIKALLMGGAVKDDGWHRDTGKPLSDHRGAGEVNFFNSYTMFRQGPEAPGTIHHRYGWDYHQLDAGKTATYRFDVPNPLGHSTIMLVWDRRILGRTIEDMRNGKPVWLSTPSMAHFYLTLSRVNEDGSLTVIQTSDSDVDNVQMVFEKSLKPGRYEIQVQRQTAEDEPWTYALAWRFDSP